MDPFAFTSLRFIIAAAVFLPVFVSRPTCRQVQIAGIELGFWSALGYVTQAMALSSTDASRASFLSTFTVILVPIINGLNGRGVAARTWIGAVVALLGVACLEKGGAPPSVGDLWGVLSATGFAI